MFANFVTESFIVMILSAATLHKEIRKKERKKEKVGRNVPGVNEKLTQYFFFKELKGKDTLQT
jgi:hypothetical protein